METQAQGKPRFRSDLVAQYLEDGGIQYVDVTDPNSGSTFRFYDVEYSIACAMNGERDLPGLAEWTKAELGIDTSADELANVVSTLADLGYLDAGGASIELGEAGGSPAAASAPMDVPSLELGLPGAGEVAGEAPVARGRVEDVELGAAGASEMPREHKPREAAPSIELGAAGASDVHEMDAGEPPPPGGGGGDVELGPPGIASIVAAKPPSPGSSDDMSFAGVMDETTKSGQRPDLVAKTREPEPAKGKVPSADFTPPPPEMPTDIKPRKTTAQLDGEEDTNIPRPVPEPDDEDVSVDLSAHLSLDTAEVREAVRQSKVMEIPEIPDDLGDDDKKKAAAEAVRKAEADDEEKTKPAMPLAAPPKTQPVAAIGTDRPKRDSAQPLPDRPAPATSRPIEPTTIPPPMPADAKGGGGGGMMYVVLLLVVAGAFGYYWFFMRGGGAEKKTSAPPAATKVAGGDRDGTGNGKSNPQPTAPAALSSAKLAQRAAQGMQVKVPVDGVVAWAAPIGTDVVEDAPVVKLQGFQKWEYQKAQAEKRLEFYMAELEKSKAANSAPAIASNEKKVEEKKGLIAEAEAEMVKVVITAPGAGKVATATKVGVPVKAGDSVASLEGGAPQLVAIFDAGDGAAAYKAEGASCTVAAKGAPDKRAACVIEGVDGPRVSVRLVEGSPFAAGDEVELGPAGK